MHVADKDQKGRLHHATHFKRAFGDVTSSVDTSLRGKSPADVMTGFKRSKVLTFEAPPVACSRGASHELQYPVFVVPVMRFLPPIL